MSVNSDSKVGFISKSQIFFGGGFTNEEYVDFIENVICDLSGYEDRFYLTSGQTWFNHQLLLAESRFYKITLSEIGDFFVLGVIVIPDRPHSQLARHCLDKVAIQIFDWISKYYDIQTDECFWTSAHRVLPAIFSRPPEAVLH